MTPEKHAPIRSVELRADWRARKWARNRMATRCDEDFFPEVAEAYRRGDRDEFLRDEIEAYRAGAAASADREEELEARVAELEAALTEAKTPSHFVNWSDEGGDFCTDIKRVIESAIYDTPPGLHLFEVMTFRQCPTVWAVVHCLTENEREALGADTDWTLTECATEAEARALEQTNP
jgi:hypothetical protein